MSDHIRAAVARHLGNAQRFLCELIAIPSLSGEEAAAMEFAEGRFASLAQVLRVPLSNALRQDRDFSDPVPDLDYQNRNNLQLVMGGADGGRTLLLNTHMDTVPPSCGQERPYDPQVRDGAVFGRGACDAKGQVATIYLAMSVLQELGLPQKGKLVVHLVAEEEVGGNGTLAMVRQGEQADGCIVLEPTEFRILSSVRGAVWFRVTLRGHAGHSGSQRVTRSAAKMGVRVMEILEGYHRRLLSSSRGDPLFDKYDNPMPLTIGKFHSGNWPASVPDEAVLEGVLGLLPNKTAKQVMDEMTEAIAVEGGREIADNFEIHFTYRHDCSVCSPDHPFVKTVQAAAGLADIDPGLAAMTASCDAWFYNNQLGIPTVAFGGGSTGVAHAANEHILVADLATAAEMIVRATQTWCAQQS